MIRKLLSGLRRFDKDERGNVTIEVMIILPVLLWLFGVGWVYFDVFRQQTVSQKANYAVGDMLSRQTDPLGEDFVANTFELFKVLTNGTDATGGLRITVAEYDADAGQWVEQWSRKQGFGTSASTSDMLADEGRLPTAANGDQLVIVETWDSYDPAFEVGLDAFEIKTFSFTRPRYAPRVLLASAD